MKTIKIFIKVIPTGLFVGCVVNNIDTIYMIKSIIEKTQGITPNNQMLFFNGITLEDDMSVTSCNIENFSVLYVAFKQDPMGNEIENVKSNQGSSEVLISVIDFVGKNIFNVARTNTVELLKAMVESKIHVSRHEHSLFLYNTHQTIQLEDGRTLESYGIKENSELWMLDPCLKILIKMPQVGNIFHVDVYDFLTVRDIKMKIWDKMGVAEDRQTLVYCGKSLADDKTLAACSLQNNSVLHAFFGFKYESQELILFIHDKRYGDTYQLLVQKWYSVLNIKTLIESMVGIPIGLQELSYLQEDLKDWKTLTHYNVECNSTLCLFVEGHPIEIFIEKSQAKGNDNEIIMLEVKNSDTIDEVLAKSPQEYMINGEILGVYCLFLGETRLKNELTLANYGIKSGTVLLLERSIQVNVGIPSGEVVIVDLKPVDSVDFVKKKIEDLCGVPLQLQTLTYLGDEVEKLYTLEDYELHLGSLWKLRWKFGGKYWSFFWPIYGV